MVLTAREVARLQMSSVPTLANAIETFGVGAANDGYNTRPLHCFQGTPRLVVGTAMTLTATTNRAPEIAPPPIDEPAYWRFVEGIDGPKLAVLQDLDDPPGGAMWGEWNASLHLALGCVGTVTDGAVRDLDALERLGFDAFATSVSVGHGYGAFVGYGEPVTVAGLRIATGDVLVADRHGVLRIPTVPIDELVDVADEIDRLESEIFAYCRAPEFTVEGLDALAQAVAARWPNPRGIVTRSGSLALPSLAPLRPHGGPPDRAR